MGNIFVQLYQAPDRRARLAAEVAKNKRRLRKLLRIGALRKHKQIQTVEWNGLTLLLDRSSLVDWCIIDMGAWETRQLQILMGALDKEPDKSNCVFLDIGAYWGLYGMMARQCGIRDIHMFEPDPRNRAQLHAQLFLNDLQSDIQVHGFAASDQIGDVPFRKSETIEDGNRGGAGLTESNISGGFSVPCKPIDSCFNYEGRTIFCKIDVEGTEVAVLNGMKNLIANNRVFMQVEVFHDNIDRVRTLATELGLVFQQRQHVDDYYSNFADMS